MKRAIAGLLLVSAAQAGIIQDVRAALARSDFASAEAQIAQYRGRIGQTPELLEAHSWLGRGALAAKQWDVAEKYARQTHELAVAELKKRRLDAEPSLPTALGASIEVQSHVLAGRGDRAGAVAYLRRELETYRTTSIRTRIQKNIHLLSLEGKPAPALDIKESLGPRLASLAALKGRPVLLFFWAHWCGDCKAQSLVLARLKSEHPDLAIVGPTQHYGYIAGGQEAPPELELRYIDQVRRQHYGILADMPVPVSEENFRSYGSSSSPTLVLLDRKGIVRLYHPGQMTYEELAPLVARMS